MDHLVFLLEMRFRLVGCHFPPETGVLLWFRKEARNGKETEFERRCIDATACD